MATRVRKQIYVDGDQEARLKRLARASGQTEAALIRQALDRYLVAPVSIPRDPAYLARLLAEPALPSPRSWRRADLHER